MDISVVNLPFSIPFGVKSTNTSPLSVLPVETVLKAGVTLFLLFISSFLFSFNGFEALLVQPTINTDIANKTKNITNPALSFFPMSLPPLHFVFNKQENPYNCHNASNCPKKYCKFLQRLKRNSCN